MRVGAPHQIILQQPFSRQIPFQAHSGKSFVEEDASEVTNAVVNSKEVVEHKEVTSFDDNRDDVLINFGTAQNAFHGAYVYTGAQCSVIGKMQALAYCEFNGQPFQPKHDSNSVVYKFGDQRVASLGSILIRFPA